MDNNLLNTILNIPGMGAQVQIPMALPEQMPQQQAAAQTPQEIGNNLLQAVNVMKKQTPTERIMAMATPQEAPAPQQNGMGRLGHMMDMQTLKEIEEQKAGAKDLENEFANYKKSQAQLSPWAALALGVNDMFNHQNTLGNYFQQQQEQRKNLLDMASKVQNAKSAVSDKQIDYLKTRLQDEKANELLKLQRELAYAKINNQQDMLDARLEAKGEGADKKDSGGKTLTASETEQLADIKNQLGSIDNIYTDWKKRGLGADNVSAYIGNNLAGYLPNTTTAEYKDNLKQKAQIIGKALEGGKLTDVDYEKYINFLPQPGDTESRAKNRIENLKTALKNAYNVRTKTFGEAGYNTSNLSPIEGAGNLSPEQEARRQALMKKQAR